MSHDSDIYKKARPLIFLNKNTMTTIEKEYQKMSQLEHILVRPDTYVGSIERDKKSFWVLNDAEDAFEERELEFVPGLYKIFDEIIVNAADNYQRGANMTYIKVDIDQERGLVSVKNDGKCIPVEIHKQEKCYVPDLIFGHLLTGSNFNDDQKKVTGGRNGYGAKLANIFSTLFIVKCGDKKRKRYAIDSSRKIKITWKNNMKKEKEELTSYDGENFTKITFKPDFKRFKMEGLESDIMHLFKKRVKLTLPRYMI